MSARRRPARSVAMFVLNDMRLDSRVQREATSLAAAGYEVTVYAVMSDATAHLGDEEADGYAIRRLPMLMRPTTATSGAPAAPTAAPLGKKLLASAFASTRPLFGGTLHYVANWQLRWTPWARRVAESVTPADVWHAHDFNTLGLAAAMASRHGGSLVYDAHEIFTEAGANSALPASVRWAMRTRERAWARRADAVLTVNDSLADHLRAALGVDPTVIRNCATMPPDDRSPLRDRLGLAHDARLVLYHGSVTFGRGLERLIAAFADDRLATTHLAIMGYGPLRPAIQALAEASPARDRIAFLPPVPPSDVTAWVAGADVAVMPIEPSTLNHRLSSPNKLFEAIAAGVPVVGPDFVEFRRIVLDSRHGALGRLHADHQAASIAAAIHDVLTLEDGERGAIRARCRTAARQRWNWQTEASVLLDVYAGLLPSPVVGRATRPAALSVAEE